MGLSHNQCAQMGAKLAVQNLRGPIASVAPGFTALVNHLLKVTATESSILCNEYIAPNKTATCGEQYY